MQCERSYLPHVWDQWDSPHLNLNRASRKSLHYTREVLRQCDMNKDLGGAKRLDA